MNIPLLESWLDPYPHHIDHTIPNSGATIIRFNRLGNHIAGACNNGAIVIWDVATMTILRILHGHASPVLCISWSRSGRYLVSGGSDWQCIIWDISSGDPISEYRFDSTVTNVAFHPIKRNLIVVSLAKTVPHIIHLDTHIRTPLHAIIPDDQLSTIHTIDTSGHLDGIEVIATWDPLGEFILCGTSKGIWSVINRHTNTCVFSDKLSSSAIRDFALSRSGTHLAITVADKTIRTYALPYVMTFRDNMNNKNNMDNLISFECVPLFKLQDLVNRFPWTGAAWTPKAEHVVGATAGRTHALCIWDAQTGSLVHLFEGPSEGMVSFAWHPTLPMCITVTASGHLSVFNTTPKDKWSAYAPDFKEIEDNIEYEEKEDEFDLEPLVNDPLLSKMKQFQPSLGPLTAPSGALPRPLTRTTIDLDTYDDPIDPTNDIARMDNDADIDTNWLITVRLEDPPMVALPIMNNNTNTTTTTTTNNNNNNNNGDILLSPPSSHELMTSLASSAMGLVAVQSDEPTRTTGSKRKRND